VEERLLLRDGAAGGEEEENGESREASHT
jgi:hypothetical protein